VNDDLRVAVGAERMAHGEQLLSQLLKVVNLAVEHDDHAPVLVRERLMPRGNVDDGQASVTQRDSGLEVFPTVVGPAMHDGATHPQEHISVDLGTRLCIENAADSAPRLIYRRTYGTVPAAKTSSYVCI
jgi:hypothetical protein